MSDGYWLEQADKQNESDYRMPDIPVRKPAPVPAGDAKEYVHMQLPDGEAVKFKRVWGEHRFTDSEVAKLIAGMEIRIDTKFARGVIGSLEWQDFNGYDYYGFSPWAAEAYIRENAPFPHGWNGHHFTKEEEQKLRAGQRVMLVCKSKSTGAGYAVNVSFALANGKDGVTRWGIVPHFEEFEMPPESFTRATAPFKPEFAGRRLTQDEIAYVRSGGRLPHEGVSKAGRPYQCHLVLGIDTKFGNRWRLMPEFG